MTAAATSRQMDEHPTERGAARRAFDWLFRDRETGKVVIAQLPNAPLAIFIVAALIRALAHPAGTVGTIVSVVASLALLWWSLDEIIRGVNPFRRFLGAAVLAAMAASLLLR
jgi:hypothetical protein